MPTPSASSENSGARLGQGHIVAPSTNRPPDGFYRNPLRRVWPIGVAFRFAYLGYKAIAARWIADYPVPTGSTFLDIGCSTGSQFARWTEESLGNRGIGVDLESPLLVEARARGFVPVRANIESLPFPAETFDLICGFGVLSYLKDPAAGLQTLNRMLKPGGRLVAAVAVRGGLRKLSYPVFQLWRGDSNFNYAPTLDVLLRDLGHAGLEVQQLSCNSLFWPFSRSLTRAESRSQKAAASWVILEATRPTPPEQIPDKASG